MGPEIALFSISFELLCKVNCTIKNKVSNNIGAVIRLQLQVFSVTLQTLYNINKTNMELYPKLITDALEQVMYPGTKKNLIESDMLADDIRIDGTR